MKTFHVEQLNYASTASFESEPIETERTIGRERV